MDPSLFAALSGLGPQTGGFNPTPADNIFAQARARSSQGLMEYALYTAPQVRNASMLTATALTGDPARAAEMLKNSSQGQLIKDTFGMAMQSGLLPGGNPMNLAASVQNTIAGSGFKIGGVGGGGSTFGYGGITDQLSRQVFDQIKNNFFSQTTGLGKSNAKGMDMSQFGDILGQLTSRGAFAGMDAFEGKFSGGKMDFKVVPEKMKKINQTLEDYAGMVKEATSIFGKLPIAQLTENAERLTGMSMGELGGIKAAKDKMANIKSFSLAYNANPEVVARNIMNATDSVQQELFAAGVQKNERATSAFNLAASSSAYGRQAAIIAEKSVFAGMQAAHASNVNANQLAEKGIYTTRFTEADAKKTYQEGHTALGKEAAFKTMSAAFYEMSQENSRIKGPDREKILELSKRMSTASVSEQRALKNQIAAIASKNGVDLSKIERNLDESEIVGGTSQELTQLKEDIKHGAVSTRLSEGQMQQLREIDIGGTLLKAGSKSESGMRSLLTKFNAGTLAEISAAIDSKGSIDEIKLNKIYEKNPSLKNIMTQDQLKETIGGIAVGQKGDVGQNMRDVFSRARTLNRGKSVINEQDTREAAAKAVQNMLADTSLGGPIDQESFGASIVRAFFGGGKIEDATIKQALINDKNVSGANLKLSEDKSRLDVSAANITDLEKTLGSKNLKSLYASLGVKDGDAEALAKALNTPEGLQALTKNLGGGLMQVDTEGNLRLFGEEAVSGKRAELEQEAMMREAKNLLGSDASFKTTGDAEKDLVRFNKEMKSGLTTDKLLGLATTSKEGKYQNKEFDALARQFKNDPTLDAHLKEKADELKDQGKTEEANQIKELRDMLKAKNTQESGQYLGILQIMNDSLSNLALYKQ